MLKEQRIISVTRVEGAKDYLLPVLKEQRIISVTRVEGAKDYLCYPC